MGTPYLGEIRMVAFSIAPKGWALCNGQTLQISQYQALFALLGTTYGGNGVQTFQLPNFQGRTAIGVGSQPGTPAFPPGQLAGEELHTLLITEMPAHNHTPIASSAGSTLPSPASNFWASGTPTPQYAASPINAQMAPNAISNAGSSQGHENRSPYLVINFIIALTGIFPTRS
jgi:microcystin-dependent protein